MSTALSKLCKACGHVQDEHLSHLIPEGEAPSNSTHCGRPECGCKQFVSPASTCDSCGEELQATQIARIKHEGEPTRKSSGMLVCRNYPKCTNAEKE